MNSRFYKGAGRVQARKIYKKGLYDNRQRIITKKCPKCGKKFETKLLLGYLNCKSCNNKV